MEKKTDMRIALTQLSQRPVAYYPAYTKLTDSVKAGVLLSQIMYWWSAVGGRKFYKTDAEITEETALSTKELRGAKKKIKELSFISVTAEGVPAKTHYDVDVESLITQIAKLDRPKGPNCDGQKGPTSKAKRAKHSITENTQETTQRDEAEPLILTPGEFNKRFFEQGLKWMQDRYQKLEGDEIIDIARWLVVDQKLGRKLGKETLRKFVDYWTEPTKSGKKLLWEKRETFDIKRRLGRFITND